MALSTSIPSARIRLKSTTMFMVMPTSCKILNDSSIDRGMARPTKKALRTPMKNNSTSTTKSNPKMMLFSRLSTIALIHSDWSEVNLITVPGGNPGCTRSITRRTS